MVTSQDISKSADIIGLWTCLAIAVVLVCARTFARRYKLGRMPLEAQDVCMYIAIVAFIICCALYLATIHTFFKAIGYYRHHMQPPSSFKDDLVVMLKEFFVVQFFFWLTLWAVKWSLLFMFKSLTDGLPLYGYTWWAIFVYSVLTFLAACVSNFFSCSSLHAWFTAGECTTPRDARAKNISLWLSLAGDLSTDLLIMIVPIRVLCFLRVSLIEKFSICFIFLVGIITMVTAIIRSVSLESSATSGQVSTTWLMLWAGIEGVVAILVGCLPSFTIFIRGRVATSRRQRGSDATSSRSPRWGLGTRSAVVTVGSSRRTTRFPWRYLDAASDKSLVEDGLTTTQSGSQRWETSTGTQPREQTESEIDHELHTLSV